MGSDNDLPLRALRARWWLLPAMVIAAVLAAQNLTLREVPLYRALASATVTPAASLSDPTELLRSLETLERRTVVATFALLAGARQTRAQAATEIGLDSADAASYRVAASVAPSTNVLRVQVEGPDASRVRDLANAVVRVTATEASRRYRLFAMEMLDPAIAPALPAHPSGQRNAMVAAILGLFVGVGLALGLELLLGGTRKDTEARRPALAA